LDIWNLGLSVAEASCSLSLSPGYDQTLVFLPQSQLGNLLHPKFALLTLYHDNHELTKGTVSIHHNDLENGIVIQDLTPYTYPGEWATSIKVTAPVEFISFVHDRLKSQVTTSKPSGAKSIEARLFSWIATLN
jgi:hypothetical protein